MTTTADAIGVEPYTLTLGEKKDNPQAQRHTVATMEVAHWCRSFLQQMPRKFEQWWSAAQFLNDYRDGDHWESACAAVTDIDFHDAFGKHTKIATDNLHHIGNAVLDDALPGTIWHCTPRGGRLIHLFDKQCSDRALVQAALEGAVARVQRALRDTGLCGTKGTKSGKPITINGFAVDWGASTNLAGFFYGPNARVGGTGRSANVVLLRDEIFDPLDLAKDAPLAERPESVEKAAVGRVRRPPRSRTAAAPGANGHATGAAGPGTNGHAAAADTEVATASARWNADHPGDWPKSGGQCPACQHHGSFGTMPAPDDQTKVDGVPRWYCFSDSHEVDGSGCGARGYRGWFGDSLDLEAHRQGVSRVAVLKESGYLVARAGTADRPVVYIPGDNCGAEVGTDVFTRGVLSAIPPGTLYRRDFIVGELVGEPGVCKFSPLSKDRTRSIIDQHARLGLQALDKKGSIKWKFCACSGDLAGVVLADAGASPAVRELHVLTRYPVFGPDFDLVRPGWNEKGGIYYDEPADLVGLEPNPECGLEVLEDLVVDFPFKDEASRHNVFGMMLTGLVVPAIKSNLPFHAVLAPLERTGKGRLINATLGICVTGREVPSMQPGSREEETEKRITSLLLDGDTVIHFDNLHPEQMLDSPALASLATTRTWKGRMLGVSRTPVLRHNLTVTLSGNNVKPSGELAKRTVLIALQPRDDKPEDRTDFIHENIEAYARSRRRDVLAALIGMVETWRRAGRPGPDPSCRMGGFEEWAQVVGGILTVAGATSWLKNYRTWIRSADTFSADAATLLRRWHARHGGKPITTKDVLDMVRETSTFPMVLTAPTETGQLVSLARRVLTPLCDRPAAGLIVRRLESGSSSSYRVEGDME